MAKWYCTMKGCDVTFGSARDDSRRPKEWFDAFDRVQACPKHSRAEIELVLRRMHGEEVAALCEGLKRDLDELKGNRK